VFAGMLGVTFFGLLLTPVFYVLVRRLTDRNNAKTAAAASEDSEQEPKQIAAPEANHV